MVGQRTRWSWVAGALIIFRIFIKYKYKYKYKLHFFVQESDTIYKQYDDTIYTTYSSFLGLGFYLIIQIIQIWLWQATCWGFAVPRVPRENRFIVHLHPAGGKHNKNHEFHLWGMRIMWGGNLCFTFTRVFVYYVFVFVFCICLCFVLPCGRGWGSSEEIGHWASPPPSPPIPPLFFFAPTLPPLIFCLSSSPQL